MPCMRARFCFNFFETGRHVIDYDNISLRSPDRPITTSIHLSLHSLAPHLEPSSLEVIKSINQVSRPRSFHLVWSF